GLTVRENLLTGTASRRYRTKEVQDDLAQVFELFPRLKERIKQRGWSLSGGEQQMLAIGRALMSRPRLLMLDEPSLGLAPIVIEQVFDKIVELNERTGLGVLLVEQNSAMALDIASRAFVLETGAITLSGSAQTLARDPRIREAYLGG
ncbi:ABC transporter ATP-binding protein, partial [Bradyrhizobium sp.]|uniref:ABC transporter ATP-binding protein n=1 Tax=Bradyrhizobium sp. TaxID=376 RepID=UPI003C5951A7